MRKVNTGNVFTRCRIAKTARSARWPAEVAAQSRRSTWLRCICAFSLGGRVHESRLFYAHFQQYERNTNHRARRFGITAGWPVICNCVRGCAGSVARAGRVQIWARECDESEGESESANRLPKHELSPSARKARSGRLALLVETALLFCIKMAYTK